MGRADEDETSVAGKTCVVTGASPGGIGIEVARALARGGARVVLACRSRSKAAAAARDIISSTGNDNVECRTLDLASLASVREFADGFNGPEELVDILVNNAGAMFKEYGVAEEGRERTWQVNTLGPTYLARLMMPALARAAAANGNAPGSARYVYVTSKLEAKGAVAGELRSGASDVRMFNAIADVARFDTFRRYATAKQAGTALTFELARRAESAPRFAGIAVHCVSPGMVNTNLGRFAGAAFALAAPLRWALTKTRAQGAEPVLFACRSNAPEVANEAGGTSARRRASRAARWWRWRRARRRGTRTWARGCGPSPRLSTARAESGTSRDQRRRRLAGWDAMKRDDLLVIEQVRIVSFRRAVYSRARLTRRRRTWRTAAWC